MSCSHCKHAIELIDVIRDLDFCTGNVVKYVVRAPYKGRQLEDLMKARTYLDWLIRKINTCENNSPKS